MKKRAFFKHLPAHRILLYLTMLMTFWMSVMLLNPKLRINVAGAEQFSGNQQAEWEKIVDAAKKEGKIGVYLQGNKEYVKEFNRAYPKIRVVDLAVGGGGARIAARVLTERRAGRFLLDVYVGGPGTPYSRFHRARALAPVRPILILREVVDQSKWFEGRHRYVDQEGRYIFLFEGTAQAYINYNTKLIRAGEFKSYWDLLNPKWRGKMVSADPRRPGIIGHATRFMYYNPELGPKFLTRLFGEMNITFSRDKRQMVDWLARGRYPICLFCYNISDAKKQGLPVDKVGPYSMKEGASIVPITGAIAIMDRAPHPNAARVFINWFLSRDGQVAYQKSRLVTGRAADSLRIDISKDEVPVSGRRRKTGKYMMSSTPGKIDMKPIRKVIQRALIEAGQR